MSPDTRAAIAAITFAHASNRKISGIHDYSSGGHRNISASAFKDDVRAYDYRSGCHVSGRLSNVYHYGNSAHIQIKQKSRGQYTGYDYATGTHFQVNVRGRNISLYDYGSGSYFNYFG